MERESDRAIAKWRWAVDAVQSLCVVWHRASRVCPGTIVHSLIGDQRPCFARTRVREYAYEDLVRGRRDQLTWRRAAPLCKNSSMQCTVPGRTIVDVQPRAVDACLGIDVLDSFVYSRRASMATPGLNPEAVAPAIPTPNIWI